MKLKFKSFVLSLLFCAFWSASVVSVAADEENLVAVDASNFDVNKTASQEPWRKNVNCVLSDSDENSEKIEKSLKIYGLPDNIDINFVRIWTDGCSMSGTSDFVERKSMVFDEAENCYELKFTTALDDKSSLGKNLTRFDMSKFNVLVFLKDKATSEPIEPLSFEVSNGGLRKPEGLEYFNNFRIDFIKTNVNAENGESFLRISSLPSNVHNIDNFSLQEESVNEQGVSYNKVVDLKNIRAKEDGTFEIPYTPKSVDSRKHITMDFVSDEGVSFLLCGYIKL